MKRLAIPAGILVALATVTGPAFAVKPRATIIHLTTNFNKALYPADCLATVATETLPAKHGDPVKWIIKNGNGNGSMDNDDYCSPVDKSLVSLHFKDDVMGMGNTVLTPHGGAGFITGVIDMGAPMAAHKYIVFYNGLQAGPDPEIEVDCPGCGGGQ